MSPDYQILREFLDQINPGFVPQGGTNYKEMLEMALDSFEQSDGMADRFLIVISDGESQQSDWQATARKLKEQKRTLDLPWLRHEERGLHTRRSEGLSKRQSRCGNPYQARTPNPDSAGKPNWRNLSRGLLVDRPRYPHRANGQKRSSRTEGASKRRNSHRTLPLLFSSRSHPAFVIDLPRVPHST